MQNIENLSVWWDTEKVGDLFISSTDQISFQYANSWLNSREYLQNKGSISLSLPASPRVYNQEAHAFFVNLLPEGEVKKCLAAQLNISDGNDAKLLELIGGDCAGALRIEKKTNTNLEPFYEPLDGFQLLEKLKKGLVLGNTQKIPERLSLAGAQGKLLLYVENSNFYSTHNGAPSNVILKTNSNPFIYLNLTENEYFSMLLASKCGLLTPNTQYKSFKNMSFLVSHRYDRIGLKAADSQENNWVEKLHQEDFCQALGILPNRKYEKEGGPGHKACAALIKNHLSLNDFSNYLDWVIFNLCIGNADAHAKNISILYSKDNSLSLAPFYDMLCTRVYSALGRSFAMNYGGTENLEEINRKTHSKFAADVQISESLLIKKIENMTQRIKLTLPILEKLLIRDGIDETILAPVTMEIALCTKIVIGSIVTH